jgi:hypothetical protein
MDVGNARRVACARCPGRTTAMPLLSPNDAMSAPCPLRLALDFDGYSAAARFLFSSTHPPQILAIVVLRSAIRATQTWTPHRILPFKAAASAETSQLAKYRCWLVPLLDEQLLISFRIAIGGTIGTGLFLGTGKSLAEGGPASMLICYTLVGAIVYVTLLLLGEMATQYPVAGTSVPLSCATPARADD